MNTKRLKWFLVQVSEEMPRATSYDRDYALNAAIEQVFAAFEPDELLDRVEGRPRRLRDSDPSVVRLLCEVARRRQESGE